MLNPFFFMNLLLCLISILFNLLKFNWFTCWASESHHGFVITVGYAGVTLGYDIHSYKNVNIFKVAFCDFESLEGHLAWNHEVNIVSVLIFCSMDASDLTYSNWLKFQLVDDVASDDRAGCTGVPDGKTAHPIVLL